MCCIANGRQLWWHSSGSPDERKRGRIATNAHMVPVDNIPGSVVYAAATFMHVLDACIMMMMMMTIMVINNYNNNINNNSNSTQTGSQRR